MADLRRVGCIERGTFVDAGGLLKVELSGSSPGLASVEQLFSEGFSNAETCSIVFYTDTTTWAAYSGAVFTTGTPNYLDLLTATEEETGSSGAPADGTSVVVYAITELNKSIVASEISDSTSAGQALITAADVAAQQTALSLVPGTNVLAYKTFYDGATRGLVQSVSGTDQTIVATALSVYPITVHGSISEVEGSGAILWDNTNKWYYATRDCLAFFSMALKIRSASVTPWSLQPRLVSSRYGTINIAGQIFDSTGTSPRYIELFMNSAVIRMLTGDAVYFAVRPNVTDTLTITGAQTTNNYFSAIALGAAP